MDAYYVPFLMAKPTRIIVVRCVVELMGIVWAGGTVYAVAVFTVRWCVDVFQAGCHLAVVSSSLLL